MLEIILTVIIYLAGAITEYESSGSVTSSIGYNDTNNTKYECKEVK